MKTKFKTTQQRLDKIENEVVAERDAAGAHIIHLAYLLEDYRIGRWLVETFPKIALLPYSGKLSEELLERKPKLKSIPNVDSLMPYTGFFFLTQCLNFTTMIGENLLHMVIVRRNYDEVRWLLDFYKDHKDSVPGGLEQLLSSNATGKFFDPSGKFS